LSAEPSPESHQEGGFMFVQGALCSCRGLDIQIWQNCH